MYIIIIIVSVYFATPLESKRDQEEGGELDSHEEVRFSFSGQGEMKRRAVGLDPQENPEIKNMEVELDPQENPEIKNMEVGLDPQENKTLKRTQKSRTWRWS